MATGFDTAAMLTVKQLRELLEKYPDATPIVYSCCSSYVALEAAQISMEEMLDKGGYADYPRTDEERLRARNFVVFPGN